MRSRYFQQCFAILFEQKVGTRMKIIFTCQVKKILKKDDFYTNHRQCFHANHFYSLQSVVHFVQFSPFRLELFGLQMDLFSIFSSFNPLLYCEFQFQFKTSYKFFPSLYRIKSQKSERGDFTKTPSNVCSCLQVLGVIVTAR